MTPLLGRARCLITAATALVIVAVMLSGCGAGVTPPSEGAAAVVPADALVYINLTLDRSDRAVTQLQSTVATLPGVSTLARTYRNLLSAVTGTRFEPQIEPWLGTDVSVALVPAGQSAHELILLQVKNRAKARTFVAAVHGPATARLIHGYVAVGTPAAVATAGTSRALGSVRAFRQAMAAAPADRVLEAYASGPGLAELLGSHTGIAAVAETVLSAEAPSTVAAALSPTNHGVAVWVRLAGTAGGSVPVSLSLASHLPAGTLWVAQMSSLVGSTPGLLSVLASASGFGSGAASVSDLVSKLGPALEAEGLATTPLQSLFNHTSAIFDLDHSIGVMTRTQNMTAAHLELGNAGQAMAELFAASNGDSDTVAPLVATSEQHGVAVTQFQEGTDSQLDLAVFDGVIVITTSQTAIDAIIDQKNSLSSSSLYRSVLPQTGSSAGPVLFGAINRLVRHGGEVGLLDSLGLGGATRLLARISAAGMASRSEGNHTTAELYFTIS